MSLAWFPKIASPVLALLTSVDTDGPHRAEFVAELSAAAIEYGAEYGVDPALLMAVGYVENRWSPDCGRVACGPYQQLARYSQMWGDDCWTDGRLTCRQPGGAGVTSDQLVKDVRLATRVAARHLRYLIRTKKDSALGAYNRGYRRMDDEIGRAYTGRVMRVYRILQPVYRPITAKAAQ